MRWGNLDKESRKHGRRIMEEESWRRNHGEGSVEEEETCANCVNEYETRTIYNRGELESQIREKIDGFDEAVCQLEKEKAKLESDLKNADSRWFVNLLKLRANNSN